MEQKKQRKENIIFALIGGLLIMIGLSLTYLLILNSRNSIISTDKDVSNSQSSIDFDLNHHDEEESYTELMGFGCLEISENYPFVYLINPDDNEVYLSFDVYEDEDLLYSSDLIEPGMMEELDIFDRLNAGKHILIYSITSYDMANRAVLWSGIKQNQEILIIK